jgi:hypothetical protein
MREFKAEGDSTAQIFSNSANTLPKRQGASDTLSLFSSKPYEAIYGPASAMEKESS